MQKALRNTSGKPTTLEDLDRREAARQKDSHRPVINAVPVATDSKAKADAAADKLDRDYEANRVAQAKAERHVGTEDTPAAKTTEFNVRSEG
jgi:alkanesulfonate monooxygenase SsuD/methylene tetrahydromethanopterin reductase-like flavin-dependent oxidoreductase (luciferase family)